MLEDSTTCSSEHGKIHCDQGWRTRERKGYSTMTNAKRTIHLQQDLGEQEGSTSETFLDALIIVDNKGSILSANAAAKASIRMTEQEQCSTLLWECAPRLVSLELYKAFVNVLRTRQSRHVDYRSPVTQNWLQAHLFPTLQGVALFFPEGREPAQERRSTHQREHGDGGLLSCITDGVAIITLEGRVLDINGSLFAHGGVRKEDLMGKSFPDLPLWPSAPTRQELVRAAIARASQGKTEKFDASIGLHPEKVRDVAWTIAPSWNAHQQVEYLICTGFDITGHKLMTEELRALTDTIPQFVWIRRSDGSIEYSNQRWHDYIHQFPVDQSAAEDLWSAAAHPCASYDEYVWRQLVHPEDRERALAAQQHALATGEPYAFEYRLKDGHTGDYRWFLSRGVPSRDQTGQIVKWFGTCTDIDEQKRTEEALCQSQKRVSQLMNSSIIGIFFAEGDTILEANATFLRMTGYSQEDLCPQRVNLANMALPAFTSLAQQVHQELVVQQYTTPFETELVCKDGSHLPVLMGGITVHDHGLQGIGFVLDNSARKELEQRKDHFLGMVSHELKTPITSLKLQTQLLRKRLGKNGIHNADTVLFRMESQLNAVTRLVEELLDLSKIQAGRLECTRETVNLDNVLQEVVETVQQMQTTHTIVVHRAASTPLLHGDKDRLGQVFLNLISNAIKYSPQAYTIEVDIKTSKDAVTLSVHDQGIGIPREQREKIFERFYRAVAPNQRTFPGLGMGLYIVAEIVKHHGGTITVESEMGKGSTFQVTLPRKKNMRNAHGYFPTTGME